MAQLSTSRAIAVALSLAAAPMAAHAAKETIKAAKLTRATRRTFIEHAQVWKETDVASMDIRTGPQGKGAFAPDAMVACDYVETKLSGTSKKFECAVSKDDHVKVRYGTDNGEVEGSVLASRLLWALGFAADREYPVRITCNGCSQDPWTDRKQTSGTQVFAPAVIERKPEGEEMKSDLGEGWAWTELALVNDQAGGATPAQRDALVLLATFMQHSDNKAEQQRLLCLPGGIDEGGVCDKPFLSIHDVGLTFGHANYLNRTPTASVNFAQWSTTPVWRDPASCVAHMSKSKTGTLGDPKISEAGRAFLANLLSRLTDQQIHDLFDVAHVTERRMKADGSDPEDAASVDQWVTAFKAKREQIVTRHCPA
jgi:hypothetical protein